MPPPTATQALHLSPPLEAPFDIAVTHAASRSRRVLKHDDTFVVVDSHGDIGASAGGADGLFYHDTRFVSRLEFLLHQMPPLMLGSNLRDDNSALVIDLTNPDVTSDHRVVLEKDTIHIVRTIFLWRDTLYQRFGVRNYGNLPVDLPVSIHFASDFADLFEVRGTHRARHGTATTKLDGADEVLMSYLGLDGKVRRTTLTFDPPPQRLTTSGASYVLRLAPGETQPIFVAAGCDQAGPRPMPYLRGMLAARREMRERTHDRTSIQTSNELFNEMLCQSAADLGILMTDTPQGRYPYAGIPWYSTTFGRDGLITALQMLWWSPDVARGVLRRLAAYQAKTTDPLADAQPGKILHEMRGGEMAALREVPFGLYYGSVDSTPLFVLLAGLYAERTGDLETVAELWPAIEAALGWIDGPGDPDGDGFLEYQRASAQGLANQGWKDFARRHLPCRRPSGGGPYRARRGARLCLCRQAHGGALRTAADQIGAGSTTRRRGGSSRRALRRGVLVRRHRRPMRSLSTATRCPAGCGRRMPDRCCSAASPTPIGRNASPRACCSRTSSPAGASARWPRAKPATIRCRITTARSGRTTTR